VTDPRQSKAIRSAPLKMHFTELIASCSVPPSSAKRELLSALMHYIALLHDSNGHTEAINSEFTINNHKTTDVFNNLYCKIFGERQRGRL
jgi:hypothetical protein